MEWMADPSAGEWLRERLDEVWSDMHSVVPRGYEAYARILHPARVAWLPDRAMPSLAEWERLPDVEREHLIERISDAPATWAEAAAAFGTTVHPLVQWNRLVRTPAQEDWHTRTAPDGREFSAPEEGSVAPDLLAAIATHLVAHTTTPDDGVAGLWEGDGALLGHFGESPSRTFFGWSDDPNHQAMLDRSSRDPFNNVFRTPTWQEGILSREISEGPRLELPGRGYVLFSAAPRTFADPAWILDAPWRDRPAEEHGFPPQALHPNLLWPADRAWTMVSEIDFDSTIVAGSADLVGAICADDRLEAFALREGADLTWNGDGLNR